MKYAAPSAPAAKAQPGRDPRLPTDLLDLKAFCLVVDLGSLTAASKMLGETKGSISRRLTRLEQALGASLLRRSPRLVQATDDGLAYRARVGRALDALEDANAEVQRAKTTPSGHLRVTAPTDLGLFVVAPLVARFAERFPEVTVEMVLTETLLDFDANQIDIALRAGGALKDSALVAHKLADLGGGFFAAPGYLDQHGRPRQPDDLHQHRLLIARSHRGTATITLKSERDQAVELRVRAAISASDYSFCRQVALEGAGIALLPWVLVEGDVRDKALVPVLEKYVAISGGFYLVHQGGRVLPPKVKAFRDDLVAAFRARKTSMMYTSPRSGEFV